MSFVEKGRTSTVNADFVVCGLPFSILRSIDISPQLPADKTATIQTFGHMPVGRNFMQDSIAVLDAARHWRPQDRPDRHRHRPPLAQHRCPGRGDELPRRVHAEPDRCRLCRRGLELRAADRIREGHRLDLLPGDRSGIPGGGVEKIWQNDPYVKGAWGWFAAGEQWMFPVAKRPEGARPLLRRAHIGMERLDAGSIRVCEPRRQRDQWLTSTAEAESVGVGLSPQFRSFGNQPQ